MRKKASVLYLSRKGWTGRVVHDELVATLGEEAIAYSMLTNYLRAVWIIPRDVPRLSDATSAHMKDSAEAILGALEEHPFSSVRQFSRVRYLRKTTVYRRFSETLGFTARLL